MPVSQISVAESPQICTLRKVFVAYKIKKICKFYFKPKSVLKVKNMTPLSSHSFWVVGLFINPNPRNIAPLKRFSHFLDG
jgi:hypothetical protein